MPERIDRLDQPAGNIVQAGRDLLEYAFGIWKKNQACVEGEVLIEGHIPAGAISSKGWMKCKAAAGVGGKLLFFGAVAMDTQSFILAKNKTREGLRITGGWTGACAGAKAGAAGGARAGAAIALAVGFAGPQAAAPEEVLTVPIGSLIGGLIGGISGSILGYYGGSQAGTGSYDLLNQGVNRP